MRNNGLDWKDGPPPANGWYWVEDWRNNKYIVFVNDGQVIGDDGMRSDIGGDYGYTRHAGPIEEPK